MSEVLRNVQKAAYTGVLHLVQRLIHGADGSIHKGSEEIS
jgi:hypothetical protein